MIKLKLILSMILLFSGLASIETACSYGNVADITGRCQACGKVYVPINSRIVGGVEAAPGSWPATAYIYMKFQGTYQDNSRSNKTVTLSTSCQGTLIDEFTVITAAQCIISSFIYNTADENNYIASVNPYNANQYTVFLGANDISSISNGESALPPIQKISVKNVINNPSFDMNTWLNDIAILQLDQPAELNEYVQLACLPNKAYGLNYPPTTKNITAFAIGWGSLQIDGSMTELLNNVKFNIYPNQYCQSDIYQGNGLIDGNYQLCAGSMEGGKDTCTGDGGGAIYILDENLGKYVAVGITSYGIGCGNQDTPGIYTRISAYTDWIQSYMGRKINNTMPILQTRPSSASKMKPLSLYLAISLLTMAKIVYRNNY